MLPSFVKLKGGKFLKRFARIAVLLCVVSLFGAATYDSADCALRTAKAKKQSARTTLHTVQTFDGVGNRDGSFDSGFQKKSHSHKETAEEINVKKREGIKLSPGMQKFADGAGKTLKNVDKAVLDVVEEPFKWFGLRAESAKIRPIHGRVGLGVSIKLHRDKKNQASDSLHKTDDSQEFYDLIKPSESSGTIRQ